MVEQDTRYWFLVERGGGKCLRYIISASSMEKVKEDFGHLAHLYDFIQLTNYQLSELTGCFRSPKHREDELAMGSLMFYHDEQNIMIRIVD